MWAAVANLAGQRLVAHDLDALDLHPRHRTARIAGAIALTHHGLGEHPSWRTMIGIRDLLTASAVLPPTDRRLLLYQRWLAEHLASVSDPEHARLLQRFVAWHQLRRLHTAATAGPLSVSSTNHARQEIKQAAAFQTWLTGLGGDLIGCRQSDLDAWFAERFASRRPSRAFLLWCINSGQLPRLHMPTRSTPSTAPLSQHPRITMLRRALTEQELPLQLRVVACLLLLYAQPVARIVRLSTQDVTDDADGLTLRLGSPPSPVPTPLDQMIREHLQQIRSRAPANRWLFPGRRADQPVHPTTPLDQLRAAGIPAGQTRITTLRHLVQQTPPPVIAQTLSYHHTSTARVANQAGSTWAQYAPGDHNK